MLPSKEAAAMKRQQQRIKDEQIMRLLDSRDELKAAIIQTDIDLQHVGYNPPMEAPGPVKYTRREWENLVEKDGGKVVDATKIPAMYKEIEIHKAAALKAHEKVETYERKFKILRSKLWAKEKKAVKKKKK